MIALEILANFVMAFSIIYILGLLIGALYAFWEHQIDALIACLVVMILPILSFVFMLLYYHFY